MERLTVPTKELPDGTTVARVIDAVAVERHAMKFYWRLKNYEDTGYTPEDFDGLCREMSDLRRLAGIDTYDNLRDAIRSGRIRVTRNDDCESIQDRSHLARDEGEKPKTNADRIGAMNNYELAAFLAKIKGDLEYDDRWVVAYSAQTMAENLNWLDRPLRPAADDEPHEYSGLVED